MAVQTNGNHVPTPTAHGAVDDSGEAVLRTILPKVLDAVGNGYNHVEGRLNEVQNHRLPSLEAKIQAFEQSHAQVKGTSNQILDLKQRLDAAEAREASLETLGQKCSLNSTRNAASIESLSTKIDKLQADSAANQKQTRDAARSFKNIPTDFDWASISSALDSVKTLSAKAEQFQREKEADARTIHNLSETVKKLQTERDRDADRFQAQSERLDRLQSQEGEHTSKLEAISLDLEKLHTNRESDSSRIKTTSENLNKLQSQQAEKASRLALNVVNEKVAKIQAHYERDWTADAEALVKKHNRKLEDRLDQTDKQFKNLSEQTRKTEKVHSGIAGFNGAISALVKRIENLESRQNNVSSNGPIHALFMRVDKLETRDASIAKVNAESQTLLKRVEKMAGDHLDVSRVGANLQALVKRVQTLEDQKSPVDIEKRMGETARLLQRLEKRLQGQDELSTGLNETMTSLISRVKTLEGQKLTTAWNETIESLLSRVKTLEGQRYKQELQDQSATARLADDVAVLLRRVNEVERKEDWTTDVLTPRVTALEGKPDVSALLNRVQVRVQTLEAQHEDKYKAGLDAAIGNLRLRIDALESKVASGTQASSNSASKDTAAHGDTPGHKPPKAVDQSGRSVSTASADVISAKESIEVPSSHRNKHPQVHPLKSQPTRSFEQTRQAERTGPVDKASLKRTLDVSDTDQATAGVRKRSRSEAAKPRHNTAKTGIAYQRSHSRRQTYRRRIGTASSPVDNARSATRRKEVAQSAGATNEDEDEDDDDSGEDEDFELEESEDEIAPRRTSRTVKPTERGSHLNFLDVNAKRNS